MNERDRLKEANKRIKQLQAALADSQIDNRVISFSVISSYYKGLYKNLSQFEGTAPVSGSFWGWFCWAIFGC